MRLQVVGHSFIVYAPLLTGCTSVLFEGKPVGSCTYQQMMLVLLHACTVRAALCRAFSTQTRPRSTLH